MNAPLAEKHFLSIVEQWRRFSIYALRHVLGDLTVRRYFHPNGYSKYVIKEYTDLSKIRLHHWTSAKPSNFHDHRWAFRSQVLAGEIVEHTLISTLCNSADNKYAVHTVRGDKLINSMSHRYLIMGGSSVYMPGQAYERTFDEIHKVESATEGAITLMMSYPPDRDHSNVFALNGSRPISARFTVESQPLSQIEHDVLQKVKL
jgi:hypothetical protein